MDLEEKQERLNHAVHVIAVSISGRFPRQEKLRRLFINCYENTAKTTVKFLEDGSVFIITGDINAMWLRDSSAQVIHYLPYLGKYEILGELVRGLIKRQLNCIDIDSYANAFNQEANSNCWSQDLSNSQSPWNWERKYEVDSLCYPIWLANEYFSRTEDKSIFTEQFRRVCHSIVSQWKREQRHDTESDYFFIRKNCPQTDTLTRDGKGEPTVYTGMTWSGFRPSDDACRYGYLIPSNMFASVVLGYIVKFAQDIFRDERLTEQAGELRKQIQDGINKYGIIMDDEFGAVYAYETDGLGNYNLMDDANVPSLLSIPWMKYADAKDKVYQNTRRFILSKRNPYYYEGTHAKGIGSPHTPAEYIWPISLIMQGLTVRSRKERKALLETLLNTDAGKDFMHESFFCNDPGLYSRDWFAWANSLFALFVMEIYPVGDK